MFFFNFIVLLIPFFFCFQSVFSSQFSRCFLLQYITICVQKLRQIWSHWSHRKQEAKQQRQRALWCYNVRSATNHIADFALLILYIIYIKSYFGVTRVVSQSRLYVYVNGNWFVSRLTKSLISVVLQL